MLKCRAAVFSAAMTYIKHLMFCRRSCLNNTKVKTKRLKWQDNVSTDLSVFSSQRKVPRNTLRAIPDHLNPLEPTKLIQIYNINNSFKFARPVETQKIRHYVDS